MKNQFPLQLERQHSVFVKRLFRRMARNLSREIRKELAAEIKGSRIRNDGIFDFISRLKNKFIGYLQGSLLEKGILKNFTTLDAWVKSKIQEQFEKNKNRLQGQIAIKPFENKGVMATQILQKSIQRNILLIQSLGEEYLNSVSNTLITGIKSGIGSKEIGKQLSEITQVSESRAEFWARDQTGKAISDLSRARQSDAGIHGYIWRTQKDGAVRDNHADLEGKYFTWKDGAPGLSAPGARHPGEDYRCRCWAEPAFGSEEQDTEMERAEAYAKMADFQYAVENQKDTGFGSQENLLRQLKRGAQFTPQGILDDWIVTSNEHQSVTVKMAAQDLFRSNAEIFRNNKSHPILPQEIVAAKKSLAEVKRQTEKHFEGVGMNPDDTVILWRGIKDKSTVGRTGVLESFSSSESKARGFAGRNGVVIKKKVKIKDILASHNTPLWRNNLDIGNEYEYIVINR